MLATFWAVVLLVVIALRPSQSTSGVANIVVRKFFHAVALAMFVPAMMMQVMQWLCVCVTHQ